MINTNDGIVTHGHYGKWSEATHIQFENHQNNATFEKVALTDLYPNDGGTWVWQLPKPLVGTPAKLGDPTNVSNGDTVHMPIQISGGKIGVLEANVDKAGEHDPTTGLPIFKLSTTSGIFILRGDSGGGTWFNGQLVGNTWFAEEATTGIVDPNTGAFIPQGPPQPTNRALAAKLPKQSFP